MSTSGRRPSILVALVMLASAFAPLLILLAALGTWEPWWVRGAFIGIAVVGIAGMWLFLKLGVSKQNQSRVQIALAKPRDGEALKFLTTYVIPFFVTTTAPPSARWGLAVYLVLLVILYVRGDLYFSNPLLGVLGWRVYEIETKDQRFMLTLSKKTELMPDQVVWLVPLGSHIYVEQDRRPQDGPGGDG